MREPDAMTSGNTSDVAAPSNLSARLVYQLRCIRLLLGNHPSVALLRRYLAYHLKRALCLGAGSDLREIESVRERFRRITAAREFTADWFEYNIPTWVAQLAAFKESAKAPAILEIGSFEGRSTLFLLTYFPGSLVTVIDLWRDAAIEARFDRNVAEYASRITKRRGRSAERLAGLLANGTSQFDLIYIDGSHFSDDVIVDATLAWPMLRAGGIMIFDDYLWFPPDHDANKSACRGVHLFLRLMEGEYSIVHVARQVMIEKTRGAGEIRSWTAPALAGKP